MHILLNIFPLRVLLVFLLSFPLGLLAQLQVSQLFSDHMVLQRNQEIRVWGWASKGQKVLVSFNGNTYKGKADKAGKWKIVLPQMKAGGPYEMQITSKEGSLALKDILIGDVWICSGQSNMEWVVANSDGFEEVIPGANDPNIRHIKVPHATAEHPDEVLEAGDWELAGPETVGSFTAVGYFFAQELRKKQDVPIGLINSSWGGSRLEPWMSTEVLKKVNYEGASFAEYKAKADAAFEASLQKYKKLFPDLQDKDPGLVDGKAHWASPSLKDSDWHPIEVGQLWEAQGFEGLDGIVWYRNTFTLTAAQAKAGIELGLGKIDDSDISYVNGTEIGKMTGAYNRARVYTVAPQFLKVGKNTLAIRVEDTGGGGGIVGEPEELYIIKGGDYFPLLEGWKLKIGEISKSGFSANQVPTILYNKMIYPLLNYPIKGAIWYQGESNAGSEEDAQRYSKLFQEMIKDWRKLWGIGDFPFLYVQLANFMKAEETPMESAWAVLRESQSDALSLPNTGQAVIIDIGEADDIHPRNKQDVGYRLALAAQKMGHGKDLVYSGPTYTSHEVKGNQIILDFDHKGSGLVARDKYGYLKGFAIAGADKKFVWAKAIIQGDQVVVWSENIEKPVHVRYAWANNPDDANFYNKEGLPASPFRTK